MVDGNVFIWYYVDLLLFSHCTFILLVDYSRKILHTIRFNIMSMCMEDDTRFLESKERENSFWFFVFIYQFFFYLNFINKNMRRNCSTQEDAIVFVFQVSTSRIETTSMWLRHNNICGKISIRLLLLAFQLHFSVIFHTIKMCGSLDFRLYFSIY